MTRGPQTLAAGSSIFYDCKHYVKRFGPLPISGVVHTTAGNLRPAIKYVLHAFGPDARENRNRQDCYDLVTSTFRNCLDYENDILESVYILLLKGISSNDYSQYTGDEVLVLLQQIILHSLHYIITQFSGKHGATTYPT